MKSGTIILVIILSIFIQSLATAADFTAQTLGDYGNVTVMAGSGFAIFLLY
jgi:hypothetical protein